MRKELFEDFVPEGPVPAETAEKYTGIVPDELTEIWKTLGFGTFYGGYLKIIDPDLYRKLLDDSYFLAKESVPVFATAFGDIIVWEKSRCIRIVEYRYHNYETMISGFGLFLRLFSDATFTSRFFATEAYKDAVSRCGELAYDECFGYVPLLALGGSENTDHLKKVKIREYIALITQMCGKI